jgi:SAM-dependent methyltransferase
MTAAPPPDPLSPLRAFWNAKATGSASDPERIEFSPRSQRVRFAVFLREHDLSGRRVLDLGCGVGDFWQHLRRRGIACDYLGVDLSPEMVRRCKERFPEGKFECRNILDWQPDRPFDYVVSFGIHNIVVPNGRHLLEQVTRRQFELASVAAHVSLLTDRFAAFAPHIQPWRAEEVLALGLSITPCAMLRHDYLPNDFSLTLYRRPLIDTAPGLLE